VPGWSSLMAVLLIASGIIMILLGFIGVYVGYIFQQVKGRPVYLIKKHEDYEIQPPAPSMNDKRR
jgi:dolichol-phosphate mannosyltransferase